MKEQQLILASASPRRQELLTRMGIAYTPCAVDVDEHMQGAPQQVVMALSERKARAALTRFPGATILGADTLVSCNGETMGKPKNEADAFRMLRMLSGHENAVYTGVCLIDGASGRTLVDSECSLVRFEELTDASIWRYIASGEPMDKAGAYAVQGMGGMFISEMKGSPSNVVGLPMHLVRKLLMELGWEL